MRKPDSYPRQNGLAIALREIGRLERTFFTLDWIEDPCWYQSVRGSPALSRKSALLRSRTTENPWEADDRHPTRRCSFSGSFPVAGSHNRSAFIESAGEPHRDRY